MSDEKKVDVDSRGEDRASLGAKGVLVDGVWLDRTKWNPTPEQFSAYFLREVAMAREKLLRDPNQRPGDTLHSSIAMSQAQMELEKEGLRAKS